MVRNLPLICSRVNIPGTFSGGTRDFPSRTSTPYLPDDDFLLPHGFLPVKTNGKVLIYRRRRGERRQMQEVRIFPDEGTVYLTETIALDHTLSQRYWFEDAAHVERVFLALRW